MTKTEIRKQESELADYLVAECGDVALAREAWIDVGASNAGWKRRGPAKAKIRKGVRKAAPR